MKKRALLVTAAFFISVFFSVSLCYPNPVQQGKGYMRDGKDALVEGKYQEAIDSYRKALDSFQEANARKGMIKALRGMGKGCEALSRYEEAVKHYQEALEIARNENMKTWEALLLDDVGSVQLTLGKREEALQYHTQAFEIHKGINQPKARANNLRMLGNVYMSLGRFKEALQHYESALELFLQEGNRGNAAKTLRNIGNVYRALGSFEEALKYYQESMKIFREINQPSQIASLQRAIGTTYRMKGQFNEALKNFEEALKTYQKLDQPYFIAREYRNVGGLYNLFGRYDEALEYQKKSMTIFKRLNMEEEVAKNYNYIGRAYLALGQYDKALEYLEEALKIFKTRDKKTHIPRSLNHIGEIHRFLGQYDKALAYHQEALKLFQEMQQPSFVMNTYDHIGNTYLAMKDYKKAEEYFAKAEAEKEKARMKKKSSFGMVNICLATNRFEQAFQLLSEMTPKWSDTDPYRMHYHTKRGSALKGMGRLEEASEEFLKAVSLIEEMRQRVSGGKVEFFRGGKTKAYRGLVSTLAERGLKGEKEDKRFATFGGDLTSVAFYFSESTKARTLLETMAESQRGKIKADIPADLSEKEKYLINELSALDLEWESAYREGENALKALTRRKEELNRDLNDLIKVLREKYPRYASLHYPRPLLPENLPLRDDEVLLEYLLSSQAGYVFVVRKGGVKKLLKIPVEGKVLRKKVKDFMKPMNILDYKDFSVKKANELYRILLSEALKDVKKDEKVIIVPDGILGLLPFEALVMKEGKGITDSIYVGDEYDLSYYQSATVLALQRVLKKAQPKRVLFALGNPIYNKKDFRYTAYKQGKSKPAAAPVDKEKFGFRSLTVGNQWGETERGGKKGREILYPPLFETEEEVRAIAEIFQVKPEPPDVLLEMAANETTLYRSPLKDYRYIHFATHADSTGKVQGIEEPFILLGQVENDKKDDGFLALSEVLSMDLDAEIVVLSACVTGRGEMMEGEGVSNFARAFQHAGAKSVLVSLWEVASMQAVDYMKGFYKHLKAGKSKSEALRLARGEIKSKYPNPFFWAVFILHGEG
jgi:tetratricopeptide (TPR) repeat protein